MRQVRILLVLALVIGCGESKSGKVIIPLDQVPEPVMKVAKEKLPDVTFEQAWRKPNGEYEVRGKNKQGKVREIDLKPSGEVTDIE